MKIKVIIAGIVVIVIGIIAALSLYTVQEGENALLLRLGVIVTDHAGNPKVIQPGLHAHLPILTSVHKFDVRLQTLDVQSSRVLTEEQKYVLVDYYVKWRINNLPLYFTRTGGFAERAQTLLHQKVNDALRAAFGKRSITEVVSGERGNVMAVLKQKADDSAKGLGIQVIDVRIKGIDLPEEVSSSVFERMRVEREQAATKHRADGKAAAEGVKAQADAQVVVTLAEANTKAAKTRAEGAKIAAKTYAVAYSKNPDFYALYRSLLVYQNTFASKHDILLLSPETQFFKYFKSAQGK